MNMLERRYRLREAIPGVKLACCDGGTDGVITVIPPGSLLQVEGPAATPSNMLRAKWHEELYAVFEADLATRSEEEEPDGPMDGRSHGNSAIDG